MQTKINVRRDNEAQTKGDVRHGIHPVSRPHLHTSFPYERGSGYRVMTVWQLRLVWRKFHCQNFLLLYLICWEFSN